MRQVTEELGLQNMTVQQFSEKLRTDPSNYYTSSQELIDGFTSIIKHQIRPRLSSVVLQMPKLDVM